MFLDDFVETSHLNLLQPKSKLALAYLVSRGLSLQEIKENKIGLSPRFFKNIDEKKDDSKDAKIFNSWLGRNGSFVKNRIVFPIRDEFSAIKGIETRSLDKEACRVLRPDFKLKFKKLIEELPSTEVRYKKFYLEKNKFMAVFYGLPEALPEIWRTKEVFLTEGIIDLLNLKHVKKNCLSPLTANFSKYQIDWLVRYVDTIYLLFDSDDKGKEAVENLKEIFERHGIQVHSISIKAKDINDYVLKFGLKEFKFYINDKLETFF